MRMVRKPSAFANREMVQHQKWTEVPQLRGTKRAADPRASTFSLLDRLKGLDDFARAQHDFWDVNYLISRGFKQRRCGGSGSGVACDGGCYDGVREEAREEAGPN